MTDYLKWDCSGLESGSGELREALAQMTALADSLRGVYRRLSQAPEEEDGGEAARVLRALLQGAEEDADRIRAECAALDGALAVYTNAGRAALRAAESLPTEIAERGLLFEDWFREHL